MTRRYLIAWLLVLSLGLLACGAGVLALSAMIMGPILEMCFAQFSASLADQLAVYVCLIALLEIAITAVIWVTRGPIVALAWVWAQVEVWQGR